MATYTKRIYKSWRVSVADQTDLTKSFDAQTDAESYAQQLKDSGCDRVHIKSYTSTGWQVRIRSKLAPSLTKTFQTKATAEVWAKEREGEIVKRQFVDYRAAEKLTLGDLLRRHDRDRLSHLHAHHPDRSRIAKLCRHSITFIRMSVIQSSDFAQFRDQRLAGGFVEARRGNEEPKPWGPVKGTSVTRELAIMSNVISLARKEWNVHLVHNPASGVLTSRPPPQPGDERDRRLSDVYQQGDEGKVKDAITAPTRDRRKASDENFELEPETAELLQMPHSEQQALLRASRYPSWFRPRKKDVTPNTVRARAKKSALPRVKARLRKGGAMWAVISFAIETAMRRGEMVKLKWSHVHLDHGNGYLLLPGLITKNKKSRIVPLSRRAKRILMTRPKVSEFVFATNANSIKMGFRRAKQRVGVTDLRLHDLRHEATSRLFEQTTLRTTEIGEVTGHTDPRMLKRYYNMRPEEFVERFAKSRK